MNENTLKGVLGVIQKAIMSIDNRFIEHTDEVAYIMLKILEEINEYSNEDILELCAVSLFHDIGSYKVGRDGSVQLNFISESNHPIYGYLFIKKFSPLKKWAEVILGYNMDEKTYKKVNKIINIPKESLILQLADYIAMSIRYGNGFFEEEILKNPRYTSLKEYLKYFKKANEDNKIINSIKDGTYVFELRKKFEEKILTKEETIQYIIMITYLIDFRSEATVMHTITVEAISKEIAKLMMLNKEQIEIVGISAALHDIGKIAIPIEILEKPSKLTEEEMAIMKSHVTLTYNILSNLGIDNIRDIAAFHHEKLDGSGYPYGLKGNEISIEVRIVAIADILTALIEFRAYKKPMEKEKVIKILKDMSHKNKIDKDITNLVISNYDCIKKNAYEESKDVWNEYINIKDEYNKLLEYL